MEVSNLGKLLIEGKTKKVFELNEDLVFVLSKDRITAGDGVKSHEIVGKSVLSTQTNCAIFEFLNFAGIPTHFVSRVINNSEQEKSFIAKKCEMIPIEWVSRRIATGSYLKRNPNVQEGYRFAPPKLETFFKDDANHDPFWSTESIIGAKFQFNGLLIEEKHVKQMLSLTRLVFEVLERVWVSRDHTLVDMKIEFGVTREGAIVVADVIDNDSWRLWPKGEKRLMLDKQVYRNLIEVDQKALDQVKDNFQIVAKRTQDIFTGLVNQQVAAQVAIILGSKSDLSFAEKVEKSLLKFGINDVKIIVSSAHKSTQKTIDVISDLEQNANLKAIIAIAGLSNGLGPVVSGNIAVPVINCPPINSLDALSLDIWSSLRMPSGMGCVTCLGADNAGQSVALIIGNENPEIWAKIKCLKVLNSFY